ncbi:hypothetical protein [Glaciecola sp. 1036]|uniref:hypothetical protein n=1 Tax=Alteromonadaceae TaxID=72275 RepID=UPI003D08928B
MKLIKAILLSLLLSIFASATQASDDYSGQWRGLLEFAPNAGIVLGVQINKTHDGYIVLLDSPNQGMQDKPVDEFSITGNTLEFKVKELNASFKGSFDGDLLSGTFSQQRKFPIELKRLDAKSLVMLDNETRWFGDLQISKSATLPLVLAVAVLNNQYHVTLDSPQQQSFGIPVDKFSITNDDLSFTSSMLNANYQADWQDGEWVGTFIQGAAMPLTLKKKALPQ